MGGYNLNKDIRNIVLMKMLFALILCVLFLGSIILDISLFKKEKELNLELETANSNNSVMTTSETFLEECNYYKENYQNINVEKLMEQLRILSDLNYSQLKFENGRTIIKMSKTTSESLQKDVKYIKDNGYYVNLDNIQKDGNEQYVEMEVKSLE